MSIEPVQTELQQQEALMRGRLPAAKRWVIKIGSALLTGDGQGIDQAGIDTWTEQIAALQKLGRQPVLVSSGAVAEGCARLGFKRRPREIHELQAAAAVGQMGLIQAYETAFQRFGLRTALILLTHDDLSNRQRYLNARATLTRLLALGVVPVINENDTVATDEIKFGDNDTLAALVTNLLQAEVLVLLTDRHGMHEADPSVQPDAPLLSFARTNDSRLDGMAGASAGLLGRGGMFTKLTAARYAARSGAMTLIANGREPEVISRLQRGESLGTLLAGDLEPLLARKRWIIGQLRTKGQIRLDAGAVQVLRTAGRSLLPVGVVATEGDYERGDLVLCLDPAGQPVAKGLINYSSLETAKILGAASDEIEGRLGFVAEPELVHRDNLVLL